MQQFAQKKKQTLHNKCFLIFIIISLRVHFLFMLTETTSLSIQVCMMRINNFCVVCHSRVLAVIVVDQTDRFAIDFLFLYIYLYFF